MKLPRRLRQLDPWYVTGFVDGEGSFTYSRTETLMNLYFSIKLTAADRRILESIQRYFGGVGKIYDVSPRAPGPGSGFTKRACLYRVSRVDELSRIVEHFGQYPLQTCKRDSYLIWHEMYLLKKENPGNPPKLKLGLLSERLSSAAPRNKRWRRRTPPL